MVKLPTPPGDEREIPELLPDLNQTDAEIYAKLKAQRAERRRKKLIRRGIAAGVVVAIVAVAAIVGSVLTREPEQTFEPITDFALRGTYMSEIGAKGTLEPLSSTVISPAVDGTIAEVRVSAGQTVAEGDVLMVIKNDELDRAVTEAERNLRDAETDLAAAKKALAAAQTPVVDEEGNYIPGDTSAAQSEVNAAERAVESARIALEDARATAAQRTVTAPSSGSIVAMNAQVGAGVGEGADASQPLMQIADLSQMKVTVQVGEEEISQVAVGQNATVTFPAFSDIALSGEVTGIASIASTDGYMDYYGEGSSVAFDVDILIAQPDARLKPGMTAQVSLVTEQVDDVIMVPTSALLTDDGESYYVMVETDPETHEAERVDVQVAIKNDDYAVVGRPADEADASSEEDGTEGLEDINNPDDGGDDGGDTGEPEGGEEAPEESGDTINRDELPISPVNDGDVLVISGGAMGFDEGLEM